MSFGQFALNQPRRPVIAGRGSGSRCTHDRLDLHDVQREIVTSRSYTGSAAFARARPTATVLCPTIASSG
jgi:hypothetical protein